MSGKTYLPRKCDGCGKPFPLKLDWYNYRTKRDGADAKFYCTRSCGSKSSTRGRLEFPCSYCGGPCKPMTEATAEYRRKQNGGKLFCSASCSAKSPSIGRLSSAIARFEAITAAGVKRCNGCGATLPIDQFSIKRHPSHDAYSSQCRRCQVAGLVRTRKDSVFESAATYSVDPNDPSLLRNCSHEPVLGPSIRAPDNRMMARSDWDEYKWSCCICGFSHKSYDEARDCCMPKGEMVGGAFVKYKEGDSCRPGHPGEARHSQATGQGA